MTVPKNRSYVGKVYLISPDWDNPCLNNIFLIQKNIMQLLSLGLYTTTETEDEIFVEK